MIKIQKESIKSTLRLLSTHGVDKINIREIEDGGQSKNEIFFTNEDNKIIEHIESQNDSANIYTTFNYFEKIPTNKSIADKDIKKIKFILLDIDPERTSGTAATNKQKEEARKVFDNCLEFLKENGIEFYYSFDSGNGYHALIPVDIENNVENKNTIKQLLNMLNEKFSTSLAKVDTIVHNPARITRLYGTLNAKGIKENPSNCRLSKVLENHSNGNTNDFNMIVKMVECNLSSNIDYNNIQKKSPYLLVKDLKKWLASYNLNATKYKDLDNGKLYKFKQCPMRNHTHLDNGHYFIVNGNKCYFGCHHASCEKQNINTFNEKYPCPEELLIKEKKYSTDIPNIERLKQKEEFKYGSYVLNENGVYLLEKDGELITISSTPVYIKEVIFNIDNNIYTYLIEALSIHNRINSFYVQGDFFNPQSLRSLLSKYGILANSEYKIYNYLQAQMRTSNSKTIHNKIGWVIYDKSVSYNLEKSYGNTEVSLLNENSIFKLSTSGSYDKIVELINNEILNSNMEIALAIGFSSIVLGYLAKEKLPDIGTFIVNLMGKSSTGKTTALHFISSIYGHPRENVSNFNSTSNALLATLYNNYGVAKVIDELSSSTISDMTSLVYQIADGRSKQRLNSDSTLKEQYKFNTTVICSSEIGFSSRLRDNPGLRMRLLEIDLDEPWSKNADSSIKIKEIVNKNYGLLSNKFIEELFSHEKGTSLIEEHFYSSKEKILSKLPDSEYKDRISIHYATILASATLLKELLGIKINQEMLLNLFIKLEKKEIPNRKGIPENIQQKILEFIHKNASRFYYDKANTRNYNKIGIIKSNISMTYADIFTGEFEKFLHRELGIEDVKLSIKRLVSEGIILTTDSKRNNTRPHISGVRENCYRIEIPKDDYNLIIGNMTSFNIPPLSDKNTTISIDNDSIDDV